jgi:N-acetylglucosaminyldiphosphoundecaprenol N-acetyl-beta-D-mannosaminyltransferase
MVIERKSVLETNISLIEFGQTLEYCSEIIKKDDRTYICLAPAHSIMDCYDDEIVKTVFNGSGLTVADGMAVVWILKMKGYQAAERIYGPDLLLALSDLSEKEGWIQYYYGSTDQVLEDLLTNLKGEFPGLKIAGKYSPIYTEGRVVETESVIEMINSASPDIIWVGLGSPKQDLWMAEHRDKLNAPLLIGVGAAFDFISGKTVQAPTWIQRNGFEWLFRLLVEPRRLWKRYRKYPLFVLLIVRELIKG